MEVRPLAIAGTGPPEASAHTWQALSPRSSRAACRRNEVLMQIYAIDFVVDDLDAATPDVDPLLGGR